MNLFGFLCCNKPPGITSRDVVNIIQRRIRSELNRRDIKIGHTGTLDPLAEGVLVVAVGPASRLVPYVQQQPKHYQATFHLGQSTVSGDLEGEITQHPDLPKPSRQQILDAADALVGTIQQTPPAHSAIWVDGQRAYKRIRAGESFQMPTRTVTVHSLKILRYDYPEIVMEICCGSGTYIRSLGIDLAIAAGSIAVMTHLVRTAVGPFAIADARSMDQLGSDDLESMLLSPVMAVGHLDYIHVDSEQSERLGHGLPITADSTAGSPIAAAICISGQLRAIVTRKNDAWYPKRVFPTLPPSSEST